MAMNIFKKIFSFLSEKKGVGQGDPIDLVSLTKDMENGKEKFMEEKELEKTTTTEETKPTENVDNSVKPENKNEQIVEKKEEEKQGATEQTPDNDNGGAVNQTEPTGNGIPIEDVVLKQDLAEALSAINSKLDAVIQENKDLKSKLAESDNKVNEMKDKYEKNDFGNYQNQSGMPKKNNFANESFEEYSKRFM